MFKLVSKFNPAGDQPKLIQEIDKVWETIIASKLFWVSLVRAKHSSHQILLLILKSRPWSLLQIKFWRLNSIESINLSFPKTEFVILSPIMTITNPKPTFHQAIPISGKNR